MTQSPQDPPHRAPGGQRPDHDLSDTSDRLYTPEELGAYAAGQRPAQPPAAPPQQSVYGDPLTDPMPGAPGAVPPPRPAHHHTNPGLGAGRRQPSGPPPSGPPTTPPPQPTPAPWSPDRQQAAPATPAAATTPPTATAPAAPTAEPAVREPGLPAEPVEGQPEEQTGEPRRFMTATDFLDRRADSQEHGPATWGWRGAVRRWSGGLISPRMGAAEVAYEQDRSMIQKDFDGPRTIAFINPKGGAAKTTGVLAAGYTFGTVRGGGVVAWDNNETRGTLGIRGTRSTHRNTTRELLEDLERFSDVYQSRIGDLGAFVRSQGDAHFDVLAPTSGRT
jgi:hypothetical protein